MLSTATCIIELKYIIIKFYLIFLVKRIYTSSLNIESYNLHNIFK